jgi:hypothetical protein
MLTISPQGLYLQQANPGSGKPQPVVGLLIDETSYRVLGALVVDEFHKVSPVREDELNRRQFTLNAVPPPEDYDLRDSVR